MTAEPEPLIVAYDEGAWASRLDYHNHPLDLALDTVDAVRADIEDIDTSAGAFPYSRVVGVRDAFEVIAEEALAAGIGASGPVGESTSHLFPAAALVRFAVAWIEQRFA